MTDFDLAMLQSQVNALQKWMSDIAQNMAGFDLRITGIEQRLIALEAIQTAQPAESPDISAATVSRDD